MDNVRLLRIISMFLVISCSLLNSSCDKKRTTRPNTVAGDVKEYYSRFKEIYGIDVNHIPASFVQELKGEKLKKDTVAICRTWSDGHKEIVIEKPYWDTLGDYGREQLVFHELGHCALNRDHDNDKDIYDCPMSIMYQFTFGDTDCYLPYRNELLQELINGG